MLGDMIPTSSPTPSPGVKQQLSTGLLQKIKVANKQWGKAKDAVLDVYKHALNDGWSARCKKQLIIKLEGGGIHSISDLATATPYELLEDYYSNYD